MKKLFLYSWLITAPITLLGGYWLYQTMERYLTYVVRYQIPDQNITLPLIGRYEFKSMLHQTKLGLSQIIDKPSKLKPVQLFVPVSNLVNLNSHMPQSGFEYVKGHVMIDGEPAKAKIKYRGDSPHRWMWKKKSLRVKTSKDSLYEGMRAFNLLAPRFTEQVNLFLSYRLAEEMELLTPRTDLNRVYLNGEDMGVHVMVEQPGELMLRAQHQMPTDIYRGEIELKDNFTDGFLDTLFSSDAGWDKVSINNHYPEQHIAPLSRMIELIQTPASADAQRGLSELLDMETWGRFSAFEMLIQTTHSDNRHNWRLYYDPWRQKMIPLVWDPVGWLDYRFRWDLDGQDASIVSENTHNRLMQALFMNADFIRARQQYLSEFFKQGKHTEFLNFVSEVTEMMEHEVHTDPLLQPVNPIRVVEEMRELNTVISELFAKIETHFSSDKIFATFHQSGNTVSLNLGGRLMVNELMLAFDKPLPESVHASVTYSDREQDYTLKLDHVIETDGKALSIKASFSPEYRVSFEQKDFLMSEVGRYKLVFKNLPTNMKLENLWVKGDFQTIQASQGKSKDGEFRRLYRPVDVDTHSEPIIWSGEQRIREDMVILNPLVIEPGSRILFDEGVSLVIKNMLTAVGTEDSPIIFTPSDSNTTHWGAVAIQGQKANGSRLEYCKMNQGSGTIDELYEYSGMLSIHDVKGIRVSHCSFANSQKVDDMVHVVYADLEFSYNHLDNALSDAIDIDISKATLIGNVIENSGNDGVDLMSSTVTAYQNIIRKNGDKGISVGEGSTLLAIENDVSGNQIGVQSKDGSNALLFNQTMRENDTAAHVYKKNWQYGDGGYIYLAKSQLQSNNQSLEAEKNSAITAFDNYLESHNLDQKRVVVSDSDNKHKNRATTDQLFPEQVSLKSKYAEVLSKFEEKWIDRIDTVSRSANLDNVEFLEVER